VTDFPIFYLISFLYRHVEQHNHELNELNALELLDSLLGWSRSQLKREVLPAIYPYHLADDLLKQLHEQIHAKSIQIDNRIAPSLHLPLHDKVLSLVLRNLLVNAIKFTQDEGCIVLTCKHDDEQTRICIENNGVGMSHETLQRLFSHHPVGSSLGTHGETGSGIGLLLCKQLLHSIKAEIHADSTPGHGSRFEIRLPA